MACETTVALDCDTSPTDSSATDGPSSQDLWDDYSCNIYGYAGSEMVYTFVPADDGEYTVDITNMTADADILILDACAPDSCVASSSSGLSDMDTLTATLTGGVEYWVIVDGYQGAQTDFDIALTCGACIDLDLDGVCEGEDCDDNDAGAYPGAPDQCGDVDSDCDGAPDIGDLDIDNDGESVCEGDCDDFNSTVYSTNVESCNGLDDNCDGSPDANEIDDDGDGDSECADDDCNDADPNVFFGAPDICGDVDTNCDGLPDAGELDADADGVTGCDGDCNDADPDNFPNNAEVCDGEDNDCSGAGLPEEIDDDFDGFNECQDLDCDDGDATIYPGAPELCDDEDNDCDGFVSGDEVDDDLDGVTECDGDCDDLDANNFPSNPEVCDLADNDCDGLPGGDEVDDDLDGFNECDGDCDDAEVAAFPGNPEICDDIDNDCSGAIDNAVVEVYAGGGVPVAVPEDTNETSGPTVVTTYIGADATIDDVNLSVSISHTYSADLDIYLISPASALTELATDLGDGDDDAYFATLFDDEAVDPISTAFTPFAGPFQPVGLLSDLDGGPTTGFWTLDINDDFTSDDGMLNDWSIELTFDGGADNDFDNISNCFDCDDNNANTAPLNNEICDGTDNDCDGDVPLDEIDEDGDGETECEGDCDASNPSSYTGAPELCDGLDNNCDGIVPANELDDDLDGFIECSGFVDAGIGLLGGEDCDDLTPTTYPGAPEVCDNIDQNCSTVADDDVDEDMCAPTDFVTATDCLITPECVVEICDIFYHDINGLYSDGCECDDDQQFGNSAATAISVGDINSGDSVILTGKMPVGGEDWAIIAFPDGSRPGISRPSIQLTANPDDAYQFELFVDDAGTAYGACTGPLTAFDFIDDQDAGGPDAGGPDLYTVNSTPWPSLLYVKVTRNDGNPSPDCSAAYEYDLTVSRL